MRIGLFTDTYFPHINGVATSVLMLKNALEKKGHEVYVVTVNPDIIKFHYDNSEKIIRIPGLKIGLYDYRLTGIYPLKAVNKIKKWKLDIIHTHTEFGVGTFARIIAKQFNVPLVHTYHTMYEDYVHYITKGYFNETGKKFVEYITMFYCDKTISELIVPTKKTYDLFKDKYHITRDVHIIPTGIELERFYKERINNAVVEKYKKELNISDKDFVILYIGRLAKEKSIDFLIDNHKDLVKENKNYKLIIIGDGPDMNSLKKLVAKNKINDNVIFTGKVPWDQVPAYYMLADLFVTASKSETQGLTVIEAMAASIPVVCVDDESFRNTVIEDVNGKFFHNKKEYKNIIKDLYENPKKLQDLKDKTRNSVEQYSIKHFGKKVLEVYRKAILDNKKKQKSLFRKIIEIFKRG
jgi:1,2-diacylglycerol 3-alpha-glucosyltransferase